MGHRYKGVQRYSLPFKVLGIGILDSLSNLITSLFSAGEQGAFYIPRPVVNGVQSLFQDAAGTTPVTADGDPVGLMLDQSQGLEVGPELFDGDFSACIQTEDGWTISADKLSCNGFELVEFVYLNDFISKFSYYEVELTVSNYVSGSLAVSLSSGEIDSPLFTSNGTYTFRGYNYSENLSFYFRSINFNGEITYLSVKEISGNQASQKTSAKRSTAVEVPPWKVAFDGVDDELVVYFTSSLGSNCTIARAVPGTGASILTGQTIGTSYTIDSDFNALVILDRALTSAETTHLTAYLNQASEV